MEDQTTAAEQVPVNRKELTNGLKIFTTIVPTGNFPASYAQWINLADDSANLEDAFAALKGKVASIESDRPTVDQMNAAIANARHLTCEIVTALADVQEPKENVIYMVAKPSGAVGSGETNGYNEYLYIKGQFEHIGDTAVDLNGYATENFVSSTLVDYTTNEALSTTLEGYTTEAELSSTLENYSTTEVVNGQLDGKLDATQSSSLAGKVAVVGATGAIEFAERTASSIAYSNAAYDYTNIQEALNAILDKINYVPMTISTFAATPAISSATNIFETGQTTPAYRFTWTTGKPATSVTFSQDSAATTIDPSVSTHTLSAGVTKDTTFKIAASDGQTSASKTLSVVFKDRIYYGGVTGGVTGDQITAEMIRGLDNSELMTKAETKGFSKDITITPGQQIMLAMPTGYIGSRKITLGGFTYSAEASATVMVENSYGHTQAYEVVTVGNAAGPSDTETVSVGLGNA